MKKLKIDNRTLYYKVVKEHHDYVHYETKFHKRAGKKSEKVWSWRKFGMIETGNMVDNFVYLFSIHRNIEDETYTKSQVREWLEENLKLIERKEEIERGEFV